MINGRAPQEGYNIVELMVAMTIGLVLLAGLAAVFANNSRARTEIERANQQTENGRYALQILTDDFHTAGYLAELDPTGVPTPAAKPNPCLFDTASLFNNAVISVQGYDNGANAPTCVSGANVPDLRAGTDILVVRRASTCAVGDAGCDPQIAGAPYLQASRCNNPAELQNASPQAWYLVDTNAAALTLHLADCATVAPLHQYRTHIYFVANDDKAGDGIPTLKRAELGVGGFAIVPLVEGVENLQIEYGLDTAAPTTGSPAAYTADPDSYNACAPATCIGYWRNVVAAKIYVLARNTTVSSGHVDTKTYTLGLNAAGNANTFGPFNDGYKRHVYESVVRLNNPAGRNTP